MTLLNRESHTDRAEGGRELELEAGRLVQRAAVASVEGAVGADFLVQRAFAAVGALKAGPARHALARAVDAMSGAPPDRLELRAALLCYGGLLERHCLRVEAVEGFEAALAMAPDDAELMLHAARSHRKAGSREAALALYRRARERGNAQVARFSSLGEALLVPAPEEALAAVLAEADAADDAEACAVTLEERAGVRRRAGRPDEAVCDYVAAALRYEDRRDRLRIAHVLADLLIARGDLEAAREALGAALDLSLDGERGHAVQRLRALAKLQGDELALRRWPPDGKPSLVSLMPAARRTGRGGSHLPAVLKMRERLRGAGV